MNLLILLYAEGVVLNVRQALWLFIKKEKSSTRNGLMTFALIVMSMKGVQNDWLP